MRTGFLLASLAQAQDYNFGLEAADCTADYFREGGEWPLQDYYGAGNTVRLCQNRNGEVHKYATLFDVNTRIPVYSAYYIMRDPNEGTNSRPDSNWHHVCFGLCLDEDDFDFSAVADQSFYSNIDQCNDCFDKCGKYQAVTYDYYDNTSGLKIDRGHLLPNGITNQDALFQRTTFTLTNVAPQHSTFNQIAWNQLECMIREYLTREIPREYVHMLTGTYGQKILMNRDPDTSDYPEKNAVRLPSHYWHAWCYEDPNGYTYAWAYAQINENDQNQSYGEYMMTVQEFSDTYYDGAAIFDNACQNAGLGPWSLIRSEWELYKQRWRCDYD